MNLNLLNLLRKVYQIVSKLEGEDYKKVLLEINKLATPTPVSGETRSSRPTTAIRRPFPQSITRTPKSTPVNDLDIKVNYTTRSGSRQDFTIVPTVWEAVSYDGIESRVCERYIYKQVRTL